VTGPSGTPGSEHALIDHVTLRYRAVSD
jgi:hypothetical protein